MVAPGRVVWVVDDSATDAARACRALEASYGCRVFTDGAAMLEHLASAGPPDVLVLDWVMPSITGLQLCRFLRSPAGGRPELPILLLTVQQSTEQIVEGLEAGANDYLSKPYALAELMARVGALVRSRDLRERAEAAEATVRRLLAQTPDALLAIDRTGVISYANPEAERILDPPGRSPLGRPVEEVVPALPWRGVVSSPTSAATGIPDLEINGAIYAPSVRLPVQDTGEVVVALRDVTARRQADAKQLDLYSVIAHDLRSPLSAMLFRNKLILDGRRGAIPAEVAADLRKMDANMLSMTALINHFLELARLDASFNRMVRTPVDLGALVERAIDDFRPLAEDKGVALRTDYPAAGAVVSADPARLTQVVTNLIANAIKFTAAAGSVTARVALADGQVETSVNDTGRGIPADALPTLFQRYVRGPVARDDGAGGTGLGLMIVREVIEAHGGTLGVSSELGQGSTFWFRLPALPPAAASSA